MRSLTRPLRRAAAALLVVVTAAVVHADTAAAATTSLALSPTSGLPTAPIHATFRVVPDSGPCPVGGVVSFHWDTPEHPLPPAPLGADCTVSVTVQPPAGANQPGQHSLCGLFDDQFGVSQFACTPYSVVAAVVPTAVATPAGAGTASSAGPTAAGTTAAGGGSSAGLPLVPVALGVAGLLLLLLLVLLVAGRRRRQAERVVVRRRPQAPLPPGPRPVPQAVATPAPRAAAPPPPPARPQPAPPRPTLTAAATIAATAGAVHLNGTAAGAPGRSRDGGAPPSSGAEEPLPVRPSVPLPGRVQPAFGSRPELAGMTADVAQPVHAEGSGSAAPAAAAPLAPAAAPAGATPHSEPPSARSVPASPAAAPPAATPIAAAPSPPAPTLEVVPSTVVDAAADAAWAPPPLRGQVAEHPFLPPPPSAPDASVALPSLVLQADAEPPRDALQLTERYAADIEDDVRALLSGFAQEGLALEVESIPQFLDTVEGRRRWTHQWRTMTDQQVRIVVALAAEPNRTADLEARVGPMVVARGTPPGMQGSENTTTDQGARLRFFRFLHNQISTAVETAGRRRPA